MTYPRVGVGVLIFDQDKLLLGQRQNSHGHLTWGPPGGHLEFGETFEACAIRETKEETGLVISKPKIIAVTNDIFEEEKKHYVSVFLRVKYLLDQKIIKMESEKVFSWEWFSLHALPEQLFLPLRNLLNDKGIQFLMSKDFQRELA